MLSRIPPGKVPEALIFFLAKSRQMATLHQISGESYLFFLQIIRPFLEGGVSPQVCLLLATL
jgi:hypothetical protein